MVVAHRAHGDDIGAELSQVDTGSGGCASRGDRDLV
jgi:hypothetical protein